MAAATIRSEDLAASPLPNRISLVDPPAGHAFSRLRAYWSRHRPGASYLVAEHGDEEVANALPEPDAQIVVSSTDENGDGRHRLADGRTELGYRNVRLFGEGIERWVATTCRWTRTDGASW